ncbi:hypothetical protein NDU88_003527 [Pleurodeles waltl]|uniref:Uncharacterized protein n=1 Tax=Pleurodeles waltl TaxID=8319 RepID=A0AAV7PE32_PLEWA|nr:hypothetical protein NDU88_003527 [Pleurodeles waltl]
MASAPPAAVWRRSRQPQRSAGVTVIGVGSSAGRPGLRQVLIVDIANNNLVKHTFNYALQVVGLTRVDAARF